MNNAFNSNWNNLKKKKRGIGLPLLLKLPKKVNNKVMKFQPKTIFQDTSLPPPLIEASIFKITHF